MSNTPRLQMPQLAANQSQKYVTMNGDLRQLDQLVQATVINQTTATPPGSPSDGDCYIVAASPTGAWTGETKALAYYNVNAWQFATPLEGWIVYDQAQHEFYYYNSSGVWTSLPTHIQTKLGLYTTGVFASKPGAPITGQQYLATDLGTAGILIVYDGTKWKPATGSAILYLNGVQTTLHTGDTAETNLKALKIPAGLLSANGGLRINFLGAATGTTNTKTFNIRWTASSGSVSGNYLIHNLSASAAQLSFAGIRHIWARNATNSQIVPAFNSADSGASSGANTATAIDTTADSYLNFNVVNANAGDASGYDAIQVEWVEA